MIITKGTVFELFGGEFQTPVDLDTDNPDEYIRIEFKGGNWQHVQLKAVADEIVIREKESN